MRKLKTTLAALTALGMSATAMGQQNIYDDNVVVDINVEVEEIAYLEVGNATGEMVIDDNQDTFMGNPSSDGTIFGTAGGTLATITLMTNFHIDAIDVNFPRVAGGPGGIRGFSSAQFFGRALGSNGHTLGVWPQIGWLDANGEINGGGGGIYGHDYSNTSLEITGKHRQNDDNGFGSGTHNFALGVSTKWDRTLQSEPEFAEPDTYTIALTATIVPSL